MAFAKDFQFGAIFQYYGPLILKKKKFRGQWPFSK